MTPEMELDILNLCQSQESMDNKRRVLGALFWAHRQAADVNNNVSKGMAMAAMTNGGSFVQAMIAGLAAIGGQHAPLGAARRLWVEWRPEEIGEHVRAGAVVPGYGNAFFKDRVDPAWEHYDVAVCRELYPQTGQRLDAFTHAMAEAGRPLYPNAAIYTAIAAEILGVPWGVEPLFFALPRLPVWAMACNAVAEQTKPSMIRT